jgi:hypothetical protein
MTGGAATAVATYLLDTGIVLGFQKCGHLDALADAASSVAVALVEEVYDEITDPRGGKHVDAASKARRVIDASKISLCSIPLGSTEARTFSAIRRGRTSSADLGEAASIAVAVHGPSYVFVTNDGAASLRSLQELRGRTMSFHPFLRVLADAGAIGPERSDEIATAIQGLRDWGATQPTWWGQWLALARG